MPEFTVTPGGSAVPAGNFKAEFVGIEPFTERSEEFGEGWLLKWKILEGDHKDEIATRICSGKFGAKSNLFKFAKQIGGKELAVGETFDFDTHRGAKGSLIVEATENGSKVTIFLRD